jgi:hypothetical protein
MGVVVDELRRPGAEKFGQNRQKHYGMFHLQPPVFNRTQDMIAEFTETIKADRRRRGGWLGWFLAIITACC